MMNAKKHEPLDPQPKTFKLNLRDFGDWDIVWNEKIAFCKHPKSSIGWLQTWNWMDFAISTILYLDLLGMIGRQLTSLFYGPAGAITSQFLVETRFLLFFCLKPISQSFPRGKGSKLGISPQETTITYYNYVVDGLMFKYFNHLTSQVPSQQTPPVPRWCPGLTQLLLADGDDLLRRKAELRDAAMRPLQAPVMARVQGDFWRSNNRRPRKALIGESSPGGFLVDFWGISWGGSLKIGRKNTPDVHDLRISEDDFPCWNSTHVWTNSKTCEDRNQQKAIKVWIWPEC